VLDKLFVQVRLAIENQIASLGSNLVAVNSGALPLCGRSFSAAGNSARRQLRIDPTGQQFRRRSEIGVRRAVGARQRSILAQFLMESSILSLAGGLIGVVAGIGLSLVAGRIVGWNVPILPTGIVMALSSSLFGGIASGIYPAQRAAQLNLVDALRFE
jgi:hypothetical protein